MEKRFSNSGLESKTPVSLVQELLAKRGHSPVYTLVYDGTNSHNPHFIFRVTGLGKTAIGEGNSKREAKHAAAEKFLNLVNDTVKDLNDAMKNPHSDKLKENVIGALQQFCQTYRLSTPKYEHVDTEGPANASIFYTKCTVSSKETIAEGPSKQQAKHIAAYQMLMELRELLNKGELGSLSEGSPYAGEQKKQTRAIELLSERLAKELIIPSFKPRKDPFSYADFFMQENVIKSEILNEMKGQKQNYFNQIFDPAEQFNKLMSQIGLQWEKSFIPVKKDHSGSMICIQIKSLHNATFFGWGEDKNRALETATLSALEWFSVMSL